MPATLPPGTTSIEIDIFSGGMLGDNASELIVDVNHAIGTTVIDNWGTMNGRMDFHEDAGSVTINNFSNNTWNTSGTNDYTDSADTVNNTGGTLVTTGSFSTFNFKAGVDQLINTNGGTINFNAVATFFFFGDDGDTLRNSGRNSKGGSVITATNLTSFYFDEPNFGLGPIPFSENGSQYNDTFRNEKGAIFNAGVVGGGTDFTSFFFGGGQDQFVNTKGAIFNANDVTTIAMGSGNDQFYNESGARFNASGLTTIFFDNPDTNVLGIPELPLVEDGPQGADQFYNQNGAAFNANDLTIIDMGTGNDQFYNRWGGMFNVNGITEIFFGDNDKVGD